MSVATLLVTLPEVKAAGMDAFAWSNRPVVIFAASDFDAMATQQLGLLDSRANAVEDRDMVVVTVWPDRVEGPVEGVTAAAMRSRYRVQAGQFAILLIGKDTGVKRRSNTVLSADDLFGQIDGMPMRRREMQGN